MLLTIVMMVLLLVLSGIFIQQKIVILLNTAAEHSVARQTEDISLLAGERFRRFLTPLQTAATHLSAHEGDKQEVLRMLTMQLKPTAGRIVYGGRDIYSPGEAQRVKNRIGVVPQHVNFDQDLTVGENMELHARLHHMERAERQARIAELLTYVELTDVINDNVRRLSGGMKRRLLIARALIHKPQILFMDEPEVSLHFEWQKQLIDLVMQLNPQLQLIMTTHSPAIVMNGWADHVTEVTDITLD